MRADRLILPPVLCVRAVAVAAGFGRLLVHASTPSDPGRPIRAILADPVRARDAGTPLLVMAAHPRCPCTRAGIAELARLVARCRGRLTSRVLFLSPRDRGADWTRTDLWRTAAAIPGVEVQEDPDGRQAARLGLATSGHVVVHDRYGRLAFSGGFTPSRGHEGDNDGGAAIAALVGGGPGDAARIPATAPVSGCSLFAAKVP